MTPQPEESPDEILARRIEFFRGSEKFYREAAKNSVGVMHAESVLAADKYKQDLAMLEAMWAQRKLIMDYMPCTCAINFGVRSGTCPKCITVRQSDDAIRGMRG